MRNQLLKIGQTIRERREVLGILQKQLEALSGVSLRTIQLVENGKANPSLDTVFKLFEPLGLNMGVSIKQLPNSDIS